MKTTPHAARGNNTQARGILQIAEVTEHKKTSSCNKTPDDKHIVLNKWTTPLVRWNRISQK
jgi:hypothetical protein